MGRLVIATKKLDSNVRNLTDCISCSVYDKVVEAVKSVCGFDAKTNTYKTPSLALKLGHGLKECTEIFISESMKLAKSRRRNAKEFLKLYKTQWRVDVSSHALRSLYTRKFNKPMILPLAEDVKVLHSFLENEARRTHERLLKEITAKDWQALCQLTLAELILFNRRRSGEVQRIPVSLFSLLKDKKDFNDDFLLGLSKIEVALCKLLKHIEIQGKKGRKVPILVTDIVSQHLTMSVDS